MRNPKFAFVLFNNTFHEADVLRDAHLGKGGNIGVLLQRIRDGASLLVAKIEAGRPPSGIASSPVRVTNVLRGPRGAQDVF